jgi:hypothetical protein
MHYLVAAGLCAVPILVLCFTGKLYSWRYFKLRGLRWGERPVEFSAYLILYLSFLVFFCYMGFQELSSGPP